MGHPRAAAAGWLLSRTLPRSIRPVIQGGLVVGGVVTLVALPAILGYGRSDNTSVLPLDYRRNLVLVLAIVAAATVGLAVRRLRKARNDRPPRSQDSTGS